MALPIHLDSAALASLEYTHEQIAASRYGIAVDQVTPEQRRSVKAARFIHIYRNPLPFKTALTKKPV